MHVSRLLARSPSLRAGTGSETLRDVGSTSSCATLTASPPGGRDRRLRCPTDVSESTDLDSTFGTDVSADGCGVERTSCRQRGRQ